VDERGNIEALDSFLGMVKEALPAKTRDEFKAQQKQELDMWHNWNNNGRQPDHLQPLYEAYKPLIANKSRVYTNRVEMPTSAIEAEFKKHFVHAVKTFNPTRGAQLNTWVQTNLQKAGRYVKTYQNMGKIPERQIANIRKFDDAKFELTQKHGIEPDTRMMADHLGWPHRRVIQMQKERRKDLPTSGFEHGDPTELLSPKEL
jgi:DNA-directed RNA polymerase specialized sigma subunit